MWAIFVHRAGFVLTLLVFAFTLSPPPRNFPVYQCPGRETAYLQYAGPEFGQRTDGETLRFLDGALVLVYTSTLLSLISLAWGFKSHNFKGGFFLGLLNSTLLSHVVCLTFLIVPAVMESCQPSTASAGELLNVLYWSYVCICFNFPRINSGEVKGKRQEAVTDPLLLYF